MTIGARKASPTPRTHATTCSGSFGLWPRMFVAIAWTIASTTAATTTRSRPTARPVTRSPNGRRGVPRARTGVLRMTATHHRTVAPSATSPTRTARSYWALQDPMSEIGALSSAATTSAIPNSQRLSRGRHVAPGRASGCRSNGTSGRGGIGRAILRLVCWIGGSRSARCPRASQIPWQLEPDSSPPFRGNRPSGLYHPAPCHAARHLRPRGRAAPRCVGGRTGGRPAGRGGPPCLPHHHGSPDRPARRHHARRRPGGAVPSSKREGVSRPPRPPAASHRPHLAARTPVDPGARGSPALASWSGRGGLPGGGRLYRRAVLSRCRLGPGSRPHLRVHADERLGRPDGAGGNPRTRSPASSRPVRHLARALRRHRRRVRSGSRAARRPGGRRSVVRGRSRCGSRDISPAAGAVLGSAGHVPRRRARLRHLDRKSTRLNSSHGSISYAVFCLKKKKKTAKRRLLQKKNKKRDQHE